MISDSAGADTREEPRGRHLHPRIGVRGEQRERCEARFVPARHHPQRCIDEGGLASLETARDEAVEVPGLAIDSERTYGKAKLTLFRA